MRMRTHFYACAVATLFLLAASGCYHAKARIEAGSASGSLNSPTELSTAINLRNTGEADAGNVQATAITVSGGTLSSPALPATIGNFAKGGNAVLGAVFTGSFAAGTSYTIHVEGTFDENGHNFKFATEATLQTLPAPGSATALSGSSPANLANGAHYPFQAPNFPKEVNEGGLGWTVPTGPNRPLKNPPSASSGVQPAPKGDPPGFDMEVDNSLGLSGGNTINEPSGAVSSGGIVFETANSYASWSKDGVHFTQLQPTTIFPNNVDGGFCCDQIVIYAPSIDRFIWVMQYWQGTNGENRYRLAAASPATVQSSNGTSWTYWDITSAQIGAGTGWVDYPDLSLGNNNVYLSADVVGGGRYVVRIPLSQIQSGSTINFNYTDYTKGGSAYGGHLAQNAQDEEFWAGQNSNSQIRVFQWPESSGSYSWTDVNIGSWPQPAGSSSSCSSTTPDKQDWLNKLLTSFPGNAVLGATRLIGNGDAKRKQNELLLAWTACAGSNFPQPQVQWVALDVNNNFNLISQQQIWNPNYAFAYPAFGVNANNDIGMSLEWGGGGNYENHVVGFWGDYIVYATTNSTVGTGRFGDYVTLRPYPPDNKRFSAYGYGITGSGADTHYVVFSRPGQ
jgi:hypothetical protein